MTSPLITAVELADALDGPRPPRVLDCRARLGEPDVGRRLWYEAHLPGSFHLDLDRDLAASPGQGGRHPLPTSDAFAQVIRRFGIESDQPVVVLDDLGGQLAAARAWWMLSCWAGHPEVRLLDGGLEAWLSNGGGLIEDGDPEVLPDPGDWIPVFDNSALVDAEQVFSGRDLKVDARSLKRFRGEVEPIDRVAGHIPGAVCRPSADNLHNGDRFKSAKVLSAELPAAESVIAYCGSGVTACHNILAYAVAGRPLPRLYAGSWSEWIKDPSRPVATGDA